jgi:hypothetical protein
MKKFYVYRQAFRFKVSYFIISDPSGYINKDASFIGSISAPSRKQAAEWLKGKLTCTVDSLLSE